MLTVASLLAAMTIAGAFWVGVLAARRLRDWGEGRRAIEDGGPTPLAIAASSSAGSGSPPDDPQTRRVRSLVAQRLRGRSLGELALSRPSLTAGEPTSERAEGERAEELGLTTLRTGDVVVLDTGDDRHHGDFIVEGVVNLREGGTTTVVANLADGDRRRWLVGSADQDRWLVVEPVLGHGLSGEPPRNIQRPRGMYSLERRGQASAASVGRHERPGMPRAATYLYRASSRQVLWVERWGAEVLMGEGEAINSGFVSFLPGS